MEYDEFWAKSPMEDGRRISNREHLSAVSELAGRFGEACGLADEARLCGMLHDFGKYSKRFQGVLRGTCSGVDHAFSSAAYLYAIKRKKPVSFGPAVEAIAGHHDGLLPWPVLRDLFEENLNQKDSFRCPSGKTAALAGQEYLDAEAAFRRDFPEFYLPSLPKRERDNSTEDMLDTRMLFSCLVDADYSASAADRDPDYPEKSGGGGLDAPAALRRLDKYCADIRRDSAADNRINQIRDQVFAECGEAGERSAGLFTLTAPTGVGKTLALLHFALRHCVRNSMRRIIVVLPYLTLAEQSERVYAQIIPEILVDHSQKDLPEEARELATRWDAPMILTTSVKFFESLFSDRPTECRKLHSLAGSVIIFDEAQSLPVGLAPATLQAIDRLCRRYRCSMVFSTATQPDFSAITGVKWKPAEIVPDNAELYRALRRVRADWRLSQKTPLSEIAAEMAEQTSVCTIVNLRRHAAKLYQVLAAGSPAEELFYLTTDLCPAHRLKIVAAVQERLRVGKPCRVVATQCIEAGVDMDFAVMYRALAPLEGIIQAAGRCNRNGKTDGGGRLTVFEPDEDGRLYPDDWYEHAAMTVKTEFARDTVDLDNPIAIRAYYRELFRDAREKEELRRALDAKDYRGVKEQYKLIENRGVQVIVPWPGMAELFLSVREEALKTGVTAALLHRAAPITVTTYHEQAVSQHAERLCFARKKGEEIRQSGVYVLNMGHEDCYDASMGLGFPELSPEKYTF